MRVKHIAVIVGLVSSVVGFVVPFWFFVAVGILLSAGYPVVAIMIGVLGDSVFGASTGFLSVVHFPFTILGVIASCAVIFGFSRLRSRKMY